MNDFNLITAAVAVSSAAGFLTTLLLSLLLLLACFGLARKVRCLRRELSEAQTAKRTQDAYITSLSSDKAHLTFMNARLAGRVRDLLAQRRALGFALFATVDELDAAQSDLRSANRQRLVEQKRGDLILEDLCRQIVRNDELSAALDRADERNADLVDSLDMTQSMFVAAQAEKRRLRRRVESLEGELWALDVQEMLDRICPVAALSDYLLPDERLSITVDMSEMLTLMVGPVTAIRHSDGNFTHITGGS